MERLIVDIAHSDKRVTAEITDAQRLEGAARAAYASLTKSLGELTARKQLAAQRGPGGSRLGKSTSARWCKTPPTASRRARV